MSRETQQQVKTKPPQISKPTKPPKRTSFMGGAGRAPSHTGAGPDLAGEQSLADMIVPSRLDLSGMTSGGGHRPVIQPKLRIGRPGDRFEQEADRVADMVTRGGVPSSFLATPSVGRGASNLIQTKTSPDEEGVESAGQSVDPTVPSIALTQPAEQEEKEETKEVAGDDVVGGEEMIAPKERRGGVRSVDDCFEARLRDGASEGLLLSESLRAFFEERLGSDLSDVRVHTDGRAADMSRELNARAFTHRNHIYFDAGEYNPGSQEGLKLLAHELTHTVQQGAGAPLIQRQPDGGDGDGNGSPEAKKKQYGYRTIPVKVEARHVGNPDLFLITAVKIALGLKSEEEARAYQTAQNRYIWGHHDEQGHVIHSNYTGPTSDQVGTTIEIQFETGLLKTAQQDVSNMKKQPGGISGVAKGKEAYDQLPPEIKKILDTSKGAGDVNYQRLLRIAKKLQELPEEFRNKWREWSKGATGDLDKLEAIINKFLEATPEQRQYFIEHVDDPNLVRSDDGVVNGGLRYSPFGLVQNENGTTVYQLPQTTSPVVGKLEFNTRVVVTSETANGWCIVVNGDSTIAGFAAMADINRFMPDPDARLYRIKSGDTAEKLIKNYYDAAFPVDLGTADQKTQMKWGEDRRFYENALTYVNTEANRFGIYKKNPNDQFERPSLIAGRQIWIPGREFVQTLKGKVGSGSFSYEAYTTARDIIVAAAKTILYTGAFIVGLIHGALESLWDLLAGLVDLLKMIWDIFVSYIQGKLLGDMIAFFSKVGQINFSELVDSAISSFEAKWNNESNPLAMWEFRGWFIGYIIMELVMTFFSAGVLAGLKWIGKAVKIEKLLAAVPTLNKIREGVEAAKLAKGAEKIEEGVKGLNKVDELADGSKVADDVSSATKHADDVSEGSHSMSIEQRIAGSSDEAAMVGPEATALQEVEQEMGKGARYASKNLPPEPVRPSTVVDEELWNRYVSYYSERVKALRQAGKESKVDPPLTWEAYEKFQSKFKRGTKFQEGVTKGLIDEAGKPGSVLSDMKTPDVQTNVGIAGKNPGETTKYADQLAVDKATLNTPNPNVQTFSNKSRQFKSGSKALQDQMERQVKADIDELITKYAGEITVRRPGHPLYNKLVKVSKVYLVYEKSMIDPNLLDAIKLIASRHKSGAVTIIFR